MNTEKIYYENPYIRTFTTNIVTQDKDVTGRTYVVLEKTAFYPTGGGQPHDIGFLNGIPVYDVEELTGEIRHFIETPLNQSTEIIGEIVWDHRFDHMQQHAGQHILSAAFENHFGYKTTSFHLGKEVCTIDLDIGSLSLEEVKEAELLANEIILKNCSIETKWVTEEELRQYPLRKKVSVSENIRLVIISDFDYNGCGGTHPSSTGEVSSIKVLNWERQKNHIRMYFVCGNRVMKQLHEKQQVILNLTSILNAPQDQMVDASIKLKQQTKDLEKTIISLTDKLIRYEAMELIANAKMVNNQLTIHSIFENRSITDLQQLAKMIAGDKQNILVLFLLVHKDKFQLVCSKGKKVPVHVNKMINEVLPAINGRGGGNESFAQGGGERIISAEELMDKLTKVIVLA